MIGAASLATPVDMAGIVRPPTTDGTIALFNLEAQIDGLQQDARFGRGTVASRAALAELITLRGLIVGRVAEYERAEEIVKPACARGSCRPGGNPCAGADARSVPSFCGRPGRP